jgi:hypothetical protein
MDFSVSKTTRSTFMCASYPVCTILLWQPETTNRACIVMISKEDIREKDTLSGESWTPSSRNLISFWQQLQALSPSEIDRDVKQGWGRQFNPTQPWTSVEDKAVTGKQIQASRGKDAQSKQEMYMVLTQCFVDLKKRIYWKTSCQREKEHLKEGWPSVLACPVLSQF